MHADYYLNTLYPLQDKVLNLVELLPVDFYLTGGTALSRAYLHHRYSDDLDFFVNGVSDFKEQVNKIIKQLTATGFKFETSVADDGYARMFIFEPGCSLKLDFVNDVPFRSGAPVPTNVFGRTDSLNNILSNKVTALSRYSPKDLVDIVFISETHSFNWERILSDASEKDLWVNPVNIAEALEQFPLEKLSEINWIIEMPSDDWFRIRINQLITNILDGSDNSLCPSLLK